MQSMAVTEPTTGSDTTKLRTTAQRKGDRYVVNGQKVWTSRLQHSEVMILLARTTPVDQVKKKSDGLSVFLVDVKDALAGGMTVKPIRNMVNHETNEVFFDDLEIPAENLIGEEGKGFRYILEGLNAERTLIAAECIGDGYWFTDKAVAYGKERVVFGRPIGQNQGDPVSDRAGLHEYRGGEPDALQGGLVARSRQALRYRSRTWQSCLPPMPHGRRRMPACRRMAASALPPNTMSSANSGKRDCIRSRQYRPT